MSWTAYILLSAVALAVYDLLKKSSVRNNAVLPVLVIATFFGALVYIGMLLSFGGLAALPKLDGLIMGLAAAKVVIVGSSWILTYRALRSLPITIATPIRASAPAVVILVAFFLYAERPLPLQWAGMALVFVGFFLFSWAGKMEGVDFLRNRAVYCAVGGMLLSAVSALWDKYVFQIAAAPVEAVQFYFQIGLFLFYAAILLVQRTVGALAARADWFEFRWSVPFVGIVLALADWLYFHALVIPTAPISVAALLRRFSVVITFVLGAIIFRERNLRRKGLALSLIVLGTAILCLAHP